MDATKINELYNTKADVDEHSKFIEDITDEKRDLLVKDLCVEGALWTASHQKNYTMHRRFLTLQSKFCFHLVNCRLLPSTHSNTVNFDRMCLIHSIFKGRNIYIGVILHQEIANCAARQTGNLIFPSLVMLLCQQKGIVLRDDEEVLENKGLIIESSIERMTHGKDTLTMKEPEASKTRKGKIKVESKGTNLTAETSLLCKMKDIEKLANYISNKQIRLVATIEDMDRSQNLFYAYTRAYKNSIAHAVEENIVVEEEDTCVEVMNEKVEEENTETEASEHESIEDIVNASKFIDATNDNLERDGARLAEAGEVTNEEHHNSLVIVV
ncbi:hypothetical protein PVK06_019736 [Gossypium arboreum]|uniref:Putative plant transposon protein domain-containing protein n=1 Tax=Gossypium arboreum TaxID=29729 RepID=A0ABR0PKI3_GOSAR|nr:hypothetical protein PVK06_019736 [Gossypium arboreum]